MTRGERIASFLATAGYLVADAEPLAQDASFRRYLRLRADPPAVLMDAPPPEDVRPFLRIAAHLRGLGLSVPSIIAADAVDGLVLEEDLGDDLLSVLLDRHHVPAEVLLDTAVDALVVMHRAAPPRDLPPWDAGMMARTAVGTLFDWWWPARFGAPAPAAGRGAVEQALAAMLEPVAAGPSGFVHRDFFAGNLLWLPRRSGPARIGILDFQSAAVGHPAYDLVSLVQDARRDIRVELRNRAVHRYLAARPELEPAHFQTAFAACAAQRHLRVACQWVRLAQRDGRPQYLVHGPRTWRLLNNALRQPAAAPLASALNRWLPVDQRGNPPELAAGRASQSANVAP
jgi:N-acetylmuramate 1-kinase